MGLTILGWVLVALGAITAVWGVSLHGFKLMSSDFMSFLTGGLVLVTIGLAIIKDLPPMVTTGAVWTTAAVGLIYTYSLKMDFMVFTAGAVCVIGLAVWLTTLLLK